MNPTKKDALTMEDELLSHVAGGYSGQATASGSFSSQTGTSLNILVSWTASREGGGQNTLYVTVSAMSYSLNTAALPNSVTLNVNGMVYSSTPNAVNYSGNTIASNTLASFVVPFATSPASITASWLFNGVYSGVSLNTITASGIALF